MDRREFIKSFTSYGLVVGSALLFGKPLSVFSDQTRDVAYDLVAIKGGNPSDMFDSGIRILGGMERFVNKRDTVVIKPNISWSVEPSVGATTNPDLVSRVVEHCIEAGARKVYVLDHTIESWKRAYEKTKVEQAVKRAGGMMVPANAKGYYQAMTIPRAERLKEVFVHEQILNADVFINIPILKHHGSTLITSAMKNLMGVIWDRWYYHRNNLHRCIAEFPLLRKPDLNIIDAYLVLKSGGPRGTSHYAELAKMKMQIISPDIVAADAAAAKTWGTEPENVQYINYADRYHLGTKDLSSLRIKRIAL